jgi:hypothetical protein
LDVINVDVVVVDTDAGRTSRWNLDNLQYICHPSATSDFLLFFTSHLKHMLEQTGFLAPGLYLLGDNTYVNTNYMTSPFKGVAGSKGRLQLLPVVANSHPCGMLLWYAGTPLGCALEGDVGLRQERQGKTDCCQGTFSMK